ETARSHRCAQVDQAGAVVVPCSLGDDCAAIRKLVAHTDECEEGEDCKELFCSIFYMSSGAKKRTTRKNDEMLTKLTDQFGKDAMQQVSAMTTRMNQNAGATIDDFKKEDSGKRLDVYDLLAIACENGDIKFTAAASYGTPSKILMLTKHSDVVTTDIIAFCPVWIARLHFEEKKGKKKQKGIDGCCERSLR
ncbi:hypothetical protein PFISCL1PPCAC_21027, partial [Pristionchus fissidentatus]